MAPSRRASNGRSPLVNPQRQITSFFSLKPSSSSSSPNSVLRASSSRPTGDRTPSPSPPQMPKIKKPPLVVSPPSDLRASSPPGIPGSGSPTPDSRKTAAEKSDAYGGEIAGRRIRVFWPLDKAWYEGCVKTFDKRSGRHAIIYDDGEEEVLDLSKEKVELLEDQARSFRRLRKSLDPFRVKPPTEMEGLKDDSSDGEVDGASADEDWGVDAKETAEDVDLVDDDEEAGNMGRTRANGVEKRKRKNCDHGNIYSAKKNKSVGNAMGNSTKVASAASELPSTGSDKNGQSELLYLSIHQIRIKLLSRNHKDLWKLVLESC